MKGFFQTLSRKNDINGNPYRLGCVYNGDGDITELIEERCSNPNYESRLVQAGYVQICTVYIGASEYNDFKRAFKRILTNG